MLFMQGLTLLEGLQQALRLSEIFFQSCYSTLLVGYVLKAERDHFLDLHKILGDDFVVHGGPR